MLTSPSLRRIIHPCGKWQSHIFHEDCTFSPCTQEARNLETQRQRHPKAILVSHGLSPYRHEVGAIHTIPSRLIPRSVLPIRTVTASLAFGCPRCHAHHVDHSVNQIQIGRLPHDAQTFAAYRLPVNRMVIPCRRHAYQQHTRYNSASRLIRTRRIPDIRIIRLRFRADACSFVRHYLRGPAYVCLYAARIASRLARGVAPSNPEKPKGRKNGEVRQTDPQHCRHRARVHGRA